MAQDTYFDLHGLIKKRLSQNYSNQQHILIKSSLNYDYFPLLYGTLNEENSKFGNSRFKNCVWITSTSFVIIHVCKILIRKNSALFSSDMLKTGNQVNFAVTSILINKNDLGYVFCSGSISQHAQASWANLLWWLNDICPETNCELRDV